MDRTAGAWTPVLCPLPNWLHRGRYTLGVWKTSRAMLHSEGLKGSEGLHRYRREELISRTDGKENGASYCKRHFKKGKYKTLSISKNQMPFPIMTVIIIHTYRSSPLVHVLNKYRPYSDNPCQSGSNWEKKVKYQKRTKRINGLQLHTSKAKSPLWTWTLEVVAPHVCAYGGGDAPL